MTRRKGASPTHRSAMSVCSSHRRTSTDEDRGSVTPTLTAPFFLMSVFDVSLAGSVRWALGLLPYDSSFVSTGMFLGSLDRCALLSVEPQ